MEPYLTQPQLLRGVRDWFAVKKYWMKWRNAHAIYMHRDSQNNDFSMDFAIFTKALRTNGPTERRTDGLTDGQTLT